MVVVGKHDEIINDTSRIADHSSFTPDYESLSKVPIMDALIRCNSQQSVEIYLLIVRNVLSVPAMGHKLIPPCINREAGLM